MIAALRTREDGRWYWTAIGALIVSAWLALAWLGATPNGHVRVHRSAHEPSATMDPQQVFFVGPRQPERSLLQVGAHLGLFLVGWTLMTVAMMLPTSLPLITLFRVVLRRRPDRAALLWALIAGYLAIWVMSGAVVLLLEGVLDAAIARIPLLSNSATYVGVGVLLLAGIYQFTPLKDRCLDACRSPMSFLAEHWRDGSQSGGSAGSNALRLGFHHGLFCLGCCWTLMLLMVFVGGVNLGWMLALGAVMAVEKAAPWGRRLVAPVGAVLLLAAAVMILRITGSVV